MVVSGGDDLNPRYRDNRTTMTEKQHTLLADRYSEIFAAIEAANIGIRAKLEMQIDSTLLGNIARLWHLETGKLREEAHDRFTIHFTHETVDVCLYAMIPKR